MKLLLLVGLLLVLGASRSYGQCAFAICNKTGAWGAGFNAGNEHYTAEEYKKTAMKACEDNGGTNCKIVGIDNDAGWWAFISGRDQNGGIAAQVSLGQASESAAKAEVLKKYRDEGGVNPDNFKITTWRVYAAGN